MNTIKNKIVLITGGAKRVGAAICRELHAHGAHLMIHYNTSATEARALQAELNLLRPNSVAIIQGDLLNIAVLPNLVNETVKHFGKLDVLINNAAISINKPISRLTLSEWNGVIAVNLTGAFLCCKYAAPHMKKTTGVILNIASTRAFMSEPDTEAYSASKGGIVALTHALSISLGPEIRVNCISPGWIEVRGWRKKSRRDKPDLSETDHSQHPAGRVGKPEDIASLAEFLISDQAGFVTGANFIADGGMTRKMIYL